MPRIVSFVGQPVRNAPATSSKDATDCMVNLPIRKTPVLSAYPLYGYCFAGPEG